MNLSLFVGEIIFVYPMFFFERPFLYQVHIRYMHYELYFKLLWSETLEDTGNGFCLLTQKVPLIFSLPISQKMRLCKPVPRQLSIFEGNDF